MAMEKPKSPTALDRTKKLKTQEMETSFVRLMKELKFKQALRAAETILSLDPGNARVKEFIPLLEEKVAMDEDEEEASDDVEDEQGEAGTADAREQPETGSQDQDESETSTSDSDDEEEEEEEADDEDGSTAHAGAAAADTIPAHPIVRRRWLHDNALGEAGVLDQGNGADAVAAGITQMALDASNSQLSSRQRLRIRDDLARSIAGLRAQELARRVAQEDPLLGA